MITDSQKSAPKCPVCRQENAILHPAYGILPGEKCNERRRKENRLPDIPIEMVGESIKRERKEYAKSIVQPYRRGELSREYLEAYGTKGIKATPEEVKKAKYVWSDIISKNTDIKKTK